MRHSCVRFLLFFPLLLLTFAASPARADIQPIGGETLLVPGARASVVTADDGRFLTVWDDSSSASPSRVYVRRFNADGTPAGSVIVVGEGEGNAAAIDGAGNFVVVYRRYMDATVGYDLFMRRFDANGPALGPEVRVNTYIANSQESGVVAMNRRGDFIVAWASSGQDGSDSGIYAQRYDATGAPVGGEFLVNQTTAQRQASPSVAIDDYGRFVVAWYGMPAGLPLVPDVYARRYDASGTPLTGEFVVNTYRSDPQVMPSVAMDPLGNFIIAWASWGQDGDGWGAYARRYTHTGQTTASEFRVNTTTAGYQDFVRVAMNAGGFVIAWQDYGIDGSYNDVVAQRYNRSGQAVGGQFRANTVRTGGQNLGYPAIDGSGSVWVVWSSDASAGHEMGTYGQRYGYPGLVTSTLTDGQVVSGLSGAATTWRYFRLPVAPEQGLLSFVTSGGWGDVDLYARYGALPDEINNDIRAEHSFNAESVAFFNPPPGSWWIGLRGYDNYGGVSLTGDYGNGPPPNEVEPNDVFALANSLTQSGGLSFGYISASSDYDYFRVSVAPGRTLSLTLYVPITRNYNLGLYNAAGSYLRASLNGTGMTEALSYTNATTTTQTYLIQVAGVSGSSSTTMPYGLIASW